MKKNNNRMKLNTVCLIKLTSGAMISGVLIGKMEFVVKDKTEKYYRLVIDKSRHIDLCENEIEEVMYSAGLVNRIEYFKDFEQKHGVKCFDDKDNLLSASVIMGKVLIRENVWDKLSEEEKAEFVEQIELEDEDVVELVDVYMKEREDCGELHSKRMRLLSKSLKFTNNFENLKNMFPDMKSAYNVFYKELGIEELLKEI